MKEIESNLLPIPKDKPTYDYYIITVNSIVVGLFTNL